MGLAVGALYQSDIHGRTGLYAFPTAHDVHDFSTARIKPVIDRSDYLRSRQRRIDPSNKGLIGVGTGLVYFRGSEARRGLDSVDADYVVFDEYDTLAHQNIPDAERRVTSPVSAGLIRRVGVPTVPDWGIARLYDESDQRRWHVRLGGVSHRVPRNSIRARPRGSRTRLGLTSTRPRETCLFDRGIGIPLRSS